LNTKVRLIIRRAYGFHTADAALALVMLGAGPIDLKLPHERTTSRSHRGLTHTIVRRALLRRRVPGRELAASAGR
jgi:hypothetical protein